MFAVKHQVNDRNWQSSSFSFTLYMCLDSIDILIHALLEEQIKEVQDFYLRDDISRMFPGKRDYRSVKNPDGKREHQQK